MDPKIKQEWVETLRSGLYKQGKGTLKYGDEYCCLGVLCEIVEGTTWNEGICSYGGSFASSILPPALASELNILEDPQLPDGRTLSEVNDTGLSFEEIADLIEIHL